MEEKERALTHALARAGAEITRAIEPASARAHARAWWARWAPQATQAMRAAVDSANPKCALHTMMSHPAQALAQGFEDSAAEALARSARAAWPRSGGLHTRAAIEAATGPFAACAHQWFAGRRGGWNLERALARLREAAQREEALKGRHWSAHARALEALAAMDERTWRAVLEEPPWAVRAAVGHLGSAGEAWLAKGAAHWKVALARRYARRKQIGVDAPAEGVRAWLAAWRWPEHAPPMAAIWAWAWAGRAPEQTDDALWAAGAQVRKDAARASAKDAGQDARETQRWLEQIDEAAAHAAQTLSAALTRRAQAAAAQWAKAKARDAGHHPCGTREARARIAEIETGWARDATLRRWRARCAGEIRLSRRFAEHQTGHLRPAWEVPWAHPAGALALVPWERGTRGVQEWMARVVRGTEAASGGLLIDAQPSPREARVVGQWRASAEERPRSEEAQALLACVGACGLR